MSNGKNYQAVESEGLHGGPVESTGLKETRRPRPHAPRFYPHSNSILFVLLVQLNSVPQLPTTAIDDARVHRSSGPIAARLARIPPCVADRIPCSVPSHGMEIGRRMSPRKCTVYPSREVMSSSLGFSDSDRAAPYRAPRSTEQGSKSRVDSAQAASTRSPIPVSAHEIVPTNSLLAPSTTHPLKLLNQEVDRSRAAQSQPRND